ncbi:MAG: hypothetical protein ACE5IP_12380 [Terriglobia bacterium]
MPDTRLQLAIEIETEGADQLTSLRRQLEDLGASGTANFRRLDASLRSLLERFRQSRQLVTSATESFLQSHRQLFTSLQPVFQGFFQRLLAGTRNFRDVFKRLLSDLLNVFLNTVSRMVAAWLSGLRQISGGFPFGNLLGGRAPARGGGFLGLLAPLLSAGFGFRTGPGGTPPFLPAGSGGGLTATNLGLFSRLGIDLRSLGPVPGGVLASGGLLAAVLGFQRGSRVLGALGGAAAGFAFGGPIGAAIGGLVGFLGGLFGRGRLKRKAAQTESEFVAFIGRVLDAVRTFQLTVQQGIQEIVSGFERFKQTVAPFGFAGRRAVGNVTPLVNQVVGDLRRLGQQRDERRQLIASLPIPEFQRGGLVGPARAAALTTSDGRILAFLHPGEAVLNRPAVQRLSPEFIQQANHSAGPAPGRSGLPAQAGPGATINIGPVIINGADKDGQEIFRDFVREARRLARDQGLPPPF